MDIRREELLKLIRGGLTPKALEEQLSNYHENDIAGILEELAPLLLKTIMTKW